ncbi:glycosyl hydrolase family 18 protein [Chimaeribacter arupi]|uniref:glycosyl hydrolase family 18 protein n=1 Tax=Chimaeribacter arupi TaxID=2060066 RepID=UPI0029444E0A|nr:glycosyl hydrolase family 18 protein [Chimaeribacter arupi]MDV5141930.1 glycosyl hydrolase family 18 protein [Chimaeribacter arupi]
MKLTLISRALLAVGLTAGAASAFALEAWNGQEGGDTMQVIFDGNVYQNAWWVGADNCPKEAAADEANNPWRYLRTATSAEMAEYGNPTTCEINGGGTPVVHDAFSSDKAYQQGDIVKYQENTYKANGAVPANSFIPAQGNPWQRYMPVETWNASKTYNKGDVVKVDGQSYEALFYTIGNNPADPANQNPQGNNGRPWKPLGPTVEYTPEQLAAAPQFNTSALYPAGQLVQFQGQPYVAQTKVQHASPTDINPWAVYIDWAGTKERVGTPKNPWPAHVYAPYVDFSLNSIPDLAKLAKEQNVNHFTMAFVVAKSGDQCLPTWGTAYNLQDYAQYSKIKALREAGGDIMVSIGGANNAPLAAACKNDADLTQLYHDIVDNLNLNVLDFDIEGTWVADHESIQRRNRAVKAVQAKWQEEGRKVGIWYTLPILPTGLTAEGLYVLEDARDAGVDLAGVNVMTMDYGNAICQSDGTEGQNIHGTCATSAIENMFHQLKKIWPAKSDKEINAMMGTTPMIGYNDVQGEVFYQSDAKLVMEDAVKRDLGMVGIWSMARDQPGIAKQVSPEHSGMTEQQAPMYAYSKIFAPFTHDDAKTNCCHRWGENDRKGAIGDIYLSDDFYGQGKAYFNLMGTGSDGKYWYYPATKSNNRYWIYLGDTEEQAIANNQELMKYHRWGENSGKGKIGDVYLSNPDSTHLALYKLIALNSDQTYGYYPRYKESNQYWEYVGDVTLNLK